MTSMIDRTHSSLNHVDEVFAMQRSQSRRLAEEEIKLIKKSHNEMNDAYHAQEWGYVISIAAGLFQIASCGFDNKNKIGKALIGIGTTLDKTGTAKVKWDEAKISRLQGLLEIVRNELQNTQSDERELIQELDQIEKMLLEAIRAEEEQRSTAFKNR